MKYLPLFFLFILILTGCSKQPVEKKIPISVEKIIPGIISEAIIQKAEKKYGKYVRKRYELFNAKLLELQNSSTEVKLEEINKFFNNVPFIDDMKIWGQKNYWATPLEFLGKDKGDCEDYVIAKYFALLNLGVDGQKLYISRVNSKNFKRAHMVLSYYETPSSIPLILDNVNVKIFPVDKRDDLIFVYNFNGNSLCFTREAGHLNNTKVFKKWDKLLDDIERDKF